METEISTAAVVSESVMDHGTAAVLIAAAMLVLNIIVHFSSGTWKISGIIQEVRRDLAAKIEAEQRAIGETFLAVRQKIADVELDIAKNNVRRESFHQAMNQLHAQCQSAEEASEERTRRLEEKIDRISDRLGRGGAAE